LPWQSALIAGAALSLSSTAFVLQMLAEKKELTRPHGRAAFGILLLQDLAVIPMLALVPLLAGDGLGASDGRGAWVDFASAVLLLCAFVIGGRYLLRPLFRLIAAAQIHEIFTATALLLVIGSALLMQWLGFSMGLGAFLAGVLVADSEYRHQLESDIEPFKGLLLGLFFIAVGMSTDLGLLAEQPVRIVSLTLGLMLTKATVLFALARAFGLRGRFAVALGLLLSQGGEFGFVLFTLAAGQGVLPDNLAGTLTLVVTLSMAMTPLAYLVYERVVRHWQMDRDPRPYDVVEERDHKVVICGFGRFGQIVARILTMRQIPFTALEINPNQVDFVKRFGNKIYYGDASRLDILRAAHVDKAALLVLAVDNVEASVRIAELMSRHFPGVALYARARDRQHALKLMTFGAKAVIRDTLYSSLALTTHVLEGLGMSAAEAREAADLFQRHDAELLARQYAIRDDEQALIQSSREAAQQLRELFESDADRKKTE
jgi:glutathione-regulated potassium-efflux system ancillary protein KefC/glutathione-regulated potassium-efflux system protein KefB